jgi:hypothetical protein
MPLLVWWVLLAAPSSNGSAQAVRAQAALSVSCGACHDRGREGDEGGFDFLLDREALVAQGLIVPARLSASKLLQRVEQGEMPPPEALMKLTPAQRKKQRDEVTAALRGWIQTGAPAEGFTQAVPDSWRFIRREELERAAARDLERTAERDRRFLRYFSLLEVHDSRLDVKTARAGLAKALNDASFKPGLVIPTPVDPDQLLLRIDLRDLGWPVDRWETTLLTAYPFGIDSGSYALERVAGDTRSRIPILRADWFLAEATRPPLYHLLLGLPATLQGLEALLHVDAARDIELARVQRAGFNGSGVSQNNRIIERHTSRLGAYWKSYDFSGSVGEQNIFARPFGPGRGNGDVRVFQHAGGEVIFRLPNGLNGYYLADHTGKRLDKAPPTIVRDARRPDGAVENGLSCVSCHARGLIAKDDQVRESALEDPRRFTAQELEKVKALYPSPAVLRASIEADNQPYLSALKTLGVDAEAVDPITVTSSRYEAELDLRAASAELGMLPTDFLAAMPKLGSKGDVLAPLRVAHGRVKRDSFNAVFPEVLARLNVGTPVRASTQPPVQRTTCGTEPASIDDRVDDCALVFADVHGWDGAAHAHRNTGGGDWSLVLQDAAARQVWRDNYTGALWAGVGHGFTQQAAVEFCVARAKTSELTGFLDVEWTLPLAREVIAARGRGLPVSLGDVWTQDVDHSDKFRIGGVAVGARGPYGQDARQSEDVMCLARSPTGR